MRVKIHGKVEEPAVAVVGAWDPLLPAHLSLFRRLRRYARRQSLASVVIHLEPSPARVLNGALEWPTYDDVMTRLAMVTECGVSASLFVRFRKQDLSAGAKEFIQSVTEHITINELWLGAQQSLGACNSGAEERIQKVARKHRIAITRLPYSAVAGQGRKVRQCLTSGDLEQAAHIVGRSPVWSQPRSGLLRLAWRPGNYVAAPLSSPSGKPGKAVLVQLARSGQVVPTCRWPDAAISWLTFFRRVAARDF
jgi:FAD synthase